MRGIWFFIGVAVGVAIGALILPRSREVEVIERIDTVKVVTPTPSVVEVLRPSLNMPKLLFVERADTAYIHKEVEVVETRKIYEDSSYRAVVRGPSLFGIEPHLESIEILQRTTTIDRGGVNRWEVGPTAGAIYTSGGGDLWFGATATRSSGRWRISSTLGITSSAKPIAEVRVGLVLWQKKG